MSLAGRGAYNLNASKKSRVGTFSVICQTQQGLASATLKTPQSEMSLPRESPSESRSPRVLFVLDTLNFGGTETQAVQVAERLQASGLQVTVACLHSDGPLTDRLEQIGIPVVRFTTRGTFCSYYGIYQLLRLAWFIRREKFDVIHAHDLWANLMAVPAARLAGAPMVFSSQRDLAHLKWYTPTRTWFIRLIHRLSTSVVTNSHAVREHVITQFRVPPHRVSILRNGVDFARFAGARGDRTALFPEVSPDEQIVAMVANMHSSVKGHRDLIEAAETICGELPQVKFVFVGEGCERSQIYEQVRRTGLEDNFLFLGYRRDIPELLSCCDISVLPSIAEGFPNAVLESLASGLPVVATCVGGTLEIIEDGKNGLLVPPGDPTALTTAILRLLRNRGLARQLARAGQNQARLHNFDCLVYELGKLYKLRPGLAAPQKALVR